MEKTVMRAVDIRAMRLLPLVRQLHGQVKGEGKVPFLLVFRHVELSR